jgi:peptidoglycan/xylan/chitin deacetylase (PgdA/CDA1 family)
MEITEKFDLIRENKELWDLFTREEEYNASLLDRYDRFRYCMSKNRDILRPKVSELLRRNTFNIEYPDNKKFSVCLTHDIDMIKLQNVSSTIKRPFYKINKKWNPLCNFEEIIALEKGHCAKSTFFIMGLGKGEKEFNYDPEELSYELRYIVDQDCEVGLHGGCYAYNDIDVLKREKKRLENALGQKVIGFRNHYLRFNVPETWEILKKAGFEYDTTLGYMDCAGFRNGMCHPYIPFNLNTNEYINIMEIPLIIMDGTLFNYMGFDLANAWAYTKQLIDTTEKYKGVLTILWHNYQAMGDKLEVYKKILDYCHEKNSWMTSGEEIYEFWKKISW